MKKVLSVVLSATMALAAFTACSGAKEAEEAKVEKIISLSPTVTEMIFELGAGDNLIGVTSYDDYPEAVFEIQQVGDTMAPDTELIASLEPDVVFASDLLSEDSLTAMNELGLNVIVISDGSCFEDMLSNLDTVGEAIGKKVEAEELSNDLLSRYEELYCAGTPSGVSVYYVVGYGEYGDYTAGEGTFIDSLITAAGATNAGAAAEGWYISQEALIEADPDYIILPYWATDFADMEPYASLSAVIEGRLVYVDNNIFDRQGPRNIEAVETIIEIINSAESDVQEAA